jgi:cysteine desulfurase
MIYLDYNATTPVDPRVLDAMMPMFTTEYANPSSKHGAGQAAAELVEHARHDVAELVGTRRRHVVFTSGTTESVNIGLRGALACAEPGRRRILIGATEHKAVAAAAEAAAASCTGKVETIGVHRDGTLDLDHLRWLLASDVAIVAVMAANNETGTINDMRRAAALAHRYGALFLCDIAQAAGKIPVTLDGWEIDMAAWSAHKLYGPKGVGALAVGQAIQKRLTPLIVGGGQERGLRSGTVNTAGIVGFGQASRLAAEEMAADAGRLRHLVRLLQELVTERLGQAGTAVEVNGYGAARLPNTVNLRFAGADADAVLACMPDVLVSSGAACSSADAEPSHVLLAMGLDADAALQSLRFSLGRPTTQQEIAAAADHVADAVARVLSLGSS